MKGLDDDIVNEESVTIEAGGADLRADLALPPGAEGIVVFAHGSGSSRRSPRNRAVAATFQHEGLATLLVDLLTPKEQRIDEKTRALRFDIPLLADRLAGAVDWAGGDARTRTMKVGLFGASTGAAAALVVAARRAEAIAAVVSRGGRGDLVGDDLPRVRAPTLLVVGGADTQVLALNQQVARRLRCPHELHVIEHATHLFAEAGALEQVGQAAVTWFTRYLST